MEGKAPFWDDVLKHVLISLGKHPAPVIAARVREEQKGQNLVLAGKKSEVLTAEFLLLHGLTLSGDVLPFAVVDNFCNSVTS